MTALVNAPRRNGQLTTADRVEKYLGLPLTEKADAFRNSAILMVDCVLEQVAVVQAIEQEHSEEDIRNAKLCSNHLWNRLRRIAGGQLSVELFCAFGSYDDRHLLNLLGKLPIQRQRELADRNGKKCRVAVAVVGVNGTETHLNMLPEEMSPEQLKQVFDKAAGIERSVSAQVAWLHSEKVKAAKPVAPTVDKYTIDNERGGVINGYKVGSLIPWSVLMMACKQRQ